MSFEIIFITEGRVANPAAEIQFDGQRLCVVRFLPIGTPEIEFVQDLYAGRGAGMTFPLQMFLETLQLAVGDLDAWRQKLESDQADA